MKLGGEFVKAGHRGMAFEQGAENGNVGGVIVGHAGERIGYERLFA